MSSPTPPPKTLVLLFDGTGKFFKKPNTNIIRLFEALEHEQPDRQMLYYQPGVGTHFLELFVTCADWHSQRYLCISLNHVRRHIPFGGQTFR